MTKWAYKRVVFDIFEIAEDAFERALNEAGQEGWELITTFERERGGNSKECFLVFKRPLEG